MATVGDPLLDLACTLSFWVEPDDPAELRALRNMPTLASGAPRRAEAIAHYSRRTGSSLGDIDFYLCFGFFRRAVIEQQKYARFVRGHASDPRYARLDASVRILRDICQRYVSGRS
jgi:aminoglycoside phosphotransferase (APT) family kinase protein